MASEKIHGVSLHFNNQGKSHVTHLASSSLPVISSKPLNAINVSRPQHLINPWEKCGNPAAMVTHSLVSFRIFLEIGGKVADFV